MKKNEQERNRFLDNDNFTDYTPKNDFIGGNKPDKYKKETEKTSTKGIGYWIFLIITFLVFYLIFAKFLFK